MSDKDNAANLVAAILIEGENQRRAQEAINNANRNAEAQRAENERIEKEAAAAKRAQKKAQEQIDDQLDDIQELNQQYRQLHGNYLQWRKLAEESQEKLKLSLGNDFYRQLMLYGARSLLFKLAPSLNIPQEIAIALAFLEAGLVYEDQGNYFSDVPPSLSDCFSSIAEMRAQGRYADLIKNQGQMRAVDRRIYTTIRERREEVARHMAGAGATNAALVEIVKIFDARYASVEGAEAILREIDAEKRQEQEAADEAKRQQEVARQRQLEHEQKLAKWAEEQPQYMGPLYKMKQGEPVPASYFDAIGERAGMYYALNSLRDLHCSDFRISFGPVENIGTFFKPRHMVRIYFDFQPKTSYSAGPDKTVFSPSLKVILGGEKRTTRDVSMDRTDDGSPWSMQPRRGELFLPVGTPIEKILFHVAFSKTRQYDIDSVDVEYIPAQPIVAGK